MWIFLYLLRPTSYIRVWIDYPKFSQSKFFAEIFVPIIISIFLTSFYFFSGQQVALIGPQGFFSSVADLCQLLAAFFLAALAAIATFGNAELDKGLRGAPAKFYRWSNTVERNEPIELSRRAFLSKLYGYLAWASIFLFIAISVFESTQDIKFPIPSNTALNVFNGFVIFSGIFYFVHIIFVAIIGVVFLIDRINNEEAQ